MQQVFARDKLQTKKESTINKYRGRVDHKPFVPQTCSNSQPPVPHAAAYYVNEYTSAAAAMFA